MSFALTSDKIAAGTKDVTRRVGWSHLKAGDLVQPVRKLRGLRRGEKVERIGGPLFIVDVRAEPLSRMLESEPYGTDECRREGFPEMTPASFVDMFCNTHKGCQPHTVVTRIEFRRT